MPKQRPTRTLLDRIKRSAKVRSRTAAISHSDALEAAAKEAGYESWFALTQAVREAVAGSPEVDVLLVDPQLPEGFYDTPNEDRSESELDEWWDRPYAVSGPRGFDVRCLDGGAWDRPTFYGVVATLEEARELARVKLQEWKRIRGRPSVLILSAREFAAVVHPQRPGDDMQILATAPDAETIEALLKKLRDTDE
ncbi:hypothetical protein [Burkholderia sp. Ac-20365]|uniref:hypothetical protein n=1 Tax=Burkholderia sp. Ac-20365 TaxID=2703897 RepID=UPI00197C6729|nr:hypothetical protein [Burkholderia sp. Ac-20365]MBN3761029.1 hypothetical protein [Burkholderia sp. Ac-20365]